MAVLAKVTGATERVDRGPDVKHRVQVLTAWVEREATVELELPRHLACARCDGGGCDACGGSGAITLRGRKDPAELITVTLPRAASDGRGTVVRIPELGGPASEAGGPRGNLLLAVVAGAVADERVRLLSSEEPEAELELAVVPPARPRPSIVLPVAVAAIAALLVIGWLLLR